MFSSDKSMGAKDEGFGWQEPARHCYILNI